MTLLVRDERDIVDAHLSFHLNAGVDFVKNQGPGRVGGASADEAGL
jgi:hypothetical protein